MKNREPYDLKYIIRIYNVCQVLYNIFMITRGFVNPGYRDTVSLFGCGTRKVSNIDMYLGYWYFFTVKLVDMVDTAFFVLRKKQSHVSFLHVFHHISMLFVVWLLLKYSPGNEVVFAGWVNSSIHIIMYTYYFFASFGDRFSFVYKYKRNLTLIQIGQFILVIIYYSLAEFLSCDYNMLVGRVMILEVSTNLILFTNFYLKTYGSRNRLENASNVIPCTPLQSHDKYLKDDNQNEIEPYTNGDALKKKD